MLTKRLSPLGMKDNLSPVSEKNGRTLPEMPPAIFEAESPDELALVHAAKAYNVQLIQRTAQSVVVSLPDRLSLAFEILKVRDVLK